MRRQKRSDVKRTKRTMKIVHVLLLSTLMEMRAFSFVVFATPFLFCEASCWLATSTLSRCQAAPQLLPVPSVSRVARKHRRVRRASENSKVRLFGSQSACIKNFCFGNIFACCLCMEHMSDDIRRRR